VQLFGRASVYDGKPLQPSHPNMSRAGWRYCRMCRRQPVL